MALHLKVSDPMLRIITYNFIVEMSANPNIKPKPKPNQIWAQEKWLSSSAFYVLLEQIIDIIGWSLDLNFAGAA